MSKPKIVPKYLVAANCVRGPLLFNKNERIMAFALAAYGEFAEDELVRLERYLRPGMVAIDVGANIGVHATAFAQMVSPGPVYAFEPHPCNFNILCGNIAMRGTQNVTPVRAMVGTEDRMHMLPLVDAEQSLNFGMLGALGLPEDEDGVPTQEIRLDTMQLNRCDLIKIDVEGHELQVLNGATDTIKRFSPVILAECNEMTDPAASLENQERLTPFFRERGYQMYWLLTRLFRPDNFNESTDDRTGWDRNILAVRTPVPELTEGLEQLL